MTMMIGIMSTNHTWKFSWPPGINWQAETYRIKRISMHLVLSPRVTVELVMHFNESLSLSRHPVSMQRLKKK